MEHFEYGERPEGPPVLGFVLLSAFVSGFVIIGLLAYMLIV